MLTMARLDPRTLGALIALYERAVDLDGWVVVGSHSHAAVDLGPPPTTTRAASAAKQAPEEPPARKGWGWPWS